MLDRDIARTLSVLRELAKGKTLYIDGLSYNIGMGEDMSVGFLYEINGEPRVVSSFRLEEFNSFLTKHHIGTVTPPYYAK